MASFSQMLRVFKIRLHRKENSNSNQLEKTHIAENQRDFTSPNNRKPYFIQIGFDFGTSFSKCIYRDIMTQKAYVYTPEENANEELPFLIPCVVLFNDEAICCLTSNDKHYPENGLYHLKTALVKVAMDDWSSPILKTYEKVSGIQNKEHLSKFIENCSVFYLGRALSEVKSKIHKHFPGFGSVEHDYIAVNMAIPVGEAECPRVNKLFHNILTDAWALTDNLHDSTAIDLKTLNELRNNLIDSDRDGQKDACYVYPEVSANVQGFVRSRLSGEGIYLFSDTGAGTVDQSIFIFHRFDKTEKLTYLCGRVLPLGSGQIELRAALISDNADVNYLEELRKKKEKEEFNNELSKSRRDIEINLSKETEKTLATAKCKLRVKKDLERMKIIFGGGGYCENPYKRAVLGPFSGQLFSQPVHPEVISIPVPRDLDLQDYQSRWMKRLSVAYGLSFEKGDLARFIYPKDVANPTPDEIWSPLLEANEAPSKDQC